MTEETYRLFSQEDNEESVHQQHLHFDWLGCLQNVKDKVSLDVSKQRITFVSDELFLICPSLEVSYRYTKHFHSVNVNISHYGRPSFSYPMSLSLIQTCSLNDVNKGTM